MIVDTSAIIAVLNHEDDWHLYDQALRNAPHILMSAATYVELGMVVDRPADPTTSRMLDRLLRTWRVEVTSLTPSQAQLARAAHRDYGLDLNDCYAYALASDTGEPLLFKGTDFTHTDIRQALAPPSATPPPSPGTG